MSATENAFASVASTKVWIATGAAVVVLSVCTLFVARPKPGPRMQMKAYMEPSTPVLQEQKATQPGHRLLDMAAPAPMRAAASAPPPPAQPVMEAKMEASNQTVAVTSDSAFAPDAPMIARNVSVTVRVKDVAAARGALDAILARTHGYSAQLAEGSPEDGPRTLSASLRVPAPELEAALGELKRLGRMVNESQSGEEVTQQHQDLVARLKTARETEERYRAILVQRTGKVSDVLEVEEQIANVRGEIERMEAEQQGLEHRVNFASVEVQFTEDYKAQLDTPSDSVLSQVRNAFVAGLRHVGDSVLGLCLFAEEYGPALVLWVVLLGGPVVLVWRRWKRRAEMAM